MIYFCDSSALVKRYIAEAGTGWMRFILQTARRGEVLVAKVTGVEMIAAFARKQRMDEITFADYVAAVADFQADYWHQYIKIQLTNQIVQLGMRFAEAHGLRGYDAIQLASAFNTDTRLKQAGLQALTFVSADNRLCTAAIAEGILTENPNSHP